MKCDNSQLDISKPELIGKLKDYIRDAQSISLDELCASGDYANYPELKYPQTKGEYLADSMSTLLASQSWIDGEVEPLLDDILEIVGLLDVDVKQPDVWQQLFFLSKKL